ncbi:hypothetical protein BTVI_40236 [Pitangus sulphuratus]|nr:hypothetical protein BTVI_40236 [Pitangus sulphuratus]
MPTGSRTDFLLLAKAKPIRSNSNASVITYLRTKDCWAEENASQGRANMGTTRQEHPHLLVYHYMDDILIAGKNLEVDQTLAKLQNQLEQRGLKIAPEKLQRESERAALVGTWYPASVNPLQMQRFE